MNFGISESIAHWARYRPENIAVYHNGEEVTYAALNKYVNLICDKIDEAAITDKRVAVAIRNKLHALIAFIAILRHGKSVVPLNIGLPDSAIIVNINDTGVISIIHDQEFSRYRTLLPNGKKLIALEVPEKLLLQDIISSFKPSAISGAEDEWGVVFSSGTTGIPKGIERTHYSVVTELLGWVIELGFNKETCFYIGRPIYYTGGLLLSLASLIVGGSIVINDYKADNDFIAIWDDYQYFCRQKVPKLAFFIPDQMRVFMRIIQDRGTQPEGAEVVLVMGAHVSGQEKQNAVELLNSKIVESWGNSESLGTITDPDDVTIRPESIGRPFLTDEMFIVGKDGEELGPNDIGRIAGSDEAGFERYSNRPDATDLTKKNQLIISDDLGYFDDDGYFYVIGREQETIIFANGPLYLPGIEAKVRSIDYISECCILALTKNKTVPELICLAELSGKSLGKNEDILTEINQRLNGNERLSYLIPVNLIPRVPSGKIDRQRCLQIIEQHV